LGRLSDVVLPDGALRRYSFDLDSNRTEITENGQTTATYTYDPANPNSQGIDQLTSATASGQTRTFSYRPDGEMTQRGSDALTWDGWGRLTGGTFSGTTITYSFDPLGFRRQREASGTTTRYLHAGLFETDGAGAITLTDVDGGAGDLAQFAGPPTTASTVTYLYYNGHGDLAAEATDQGVRTNAFSYDPFGAPNQMPPPNRAVERWTAQWDKKLDTASGLVEMGRRPYDPIIGRFASLDPVEEGSLNAYDYAAQDPINKFDLGGCFWHPPLPHIGLPSTKHICLVSCTTALSAVCASFALLGPEAEPFAIACEAAAVKWCHDHCKEGGFEAIASVPSLAKRFRGAMKKRYSVWKRHH